MPAIVIIAMMVHALLLMHFPLALVTAGIMGNIVIVTCVTVRHVMDMVHVLLIPTMVTVISAIVILDIQVVIVQ